MSLLTAAKTKYPVSWVEPWKEYQCFWEPGRPIAKSIWKEVMHNSNYFLDQFTIPLFMSSWAAVHTYRSTERWICLETCYWYEATRSTFFYLRLYCPMINVYNFLWKQFVGKPWDPEKSQKVTRAIDIFLGLKSTIKLIKWTNEIRNIKTSLHLKHRIDTLQWTHLFCRLTFMHPSLSGFSPLILE